ncbi:hypothetical protein CPC08DRAFT_317901 [Agrocybe pediades]|nr:hypothetical protein CPC08DRAFT_317901 [Agrocybe pediades]
MELGSNFVFNTKPSTESHDVVYKDLDCHDTPPNTLHCVGVCISSNPSCSDNTIMAQKPPAGKIKNFFAKLACHRDPDLSPNPSVPPSTNPNRPPSPNASHLPFPNATPPSANATPPSPIHSHPASPNPSRPTSPNPSHLPSPNPSHPPSSNPNPTPPTNHQEQPEQRNIIKDYGATVWEATETALRLLEKSADACAPLKSTVGGLVACLDLAKGIVKNMQSCLKSSKTWLALSNLMH